MRRRAVDLECSYQARYRRRRHVLGYKSVLLVGITSLVKNPRKEKGNKYMTNKLILAENSPGEEKVDEKLLASYAH